METCKQPLWRPVPSGEALHVLHLAERGCNATSSMIKQDGTFESAFHFDSSCKSVSQTILRTSTFCSRVHARSVKRIFALLAWPFVALRFTRALEGRGLARAGLISVFYSVETVIMSFIRHEDLTHEFCFILVEDVWTSNALVFGFITLI